MNFLARFVKAKDLDCTSKQDEVEPPAPAPALAAAAAAPRSMYEGILKLKEKSESQGDSSAGAVMSAEKPKKVTKKQRRKALSEPEQRRLLDLAFSSAESGDVDGLHSAAESGHDMGRKDQFGWTLLMVAASAGHRAVVEYLLRYHRSSIDFTASEATGCDASRLAHRGGHPEIAKLIDHPPPLAPALPPPDDTPVPPWTCPECKSEQTQPPAIHNATIAHLVCCGHVIAPRPFALTAANRGYQMMLRGGWEESGLGAHGKGRLQPVPTTLKRDRSGVGDADASNQTKITHFRPRDEAAVEQVIMKTVPALRGQKEILAWDAADRAARRRIRDELS